MASMWTSRENLLLGFGKPINFGKCKICKGTDFMETDDGEVICNGCGTRNEEVFSQNVLDSEFSTSQPNIYNKRVSQVTARHRIVVEDPDIDPNIVVRDCLKAFQWLLKKQVNQLCKAPIMCYDDAQKLHDCTKSIWFKYLRAGLANGRDEVSLLTLFLFPKNFSGTGIVTTNCRSKYFLDDDDEEYISLFDLRGSGATRNRRPFEKKNQYLLLRTSLAFCYLALRSLDCPVLTSDLARWVRNGSLMLGSTYTQLPSELRSRLYFRRHFFMQQEDTRATTLTDTLAFKLLTQARAIAPLVSPNVKTFISNKLQFARCLPRLVHESGVVSLVMEIDQGSFASISNRLLSRGLQCVLALQLDTDNRIVSFLGQSLAAALVIAAKVEYVGLSEQGQPLPSERSSGAGPSRPHWSADGGVVPEALSEVLRATGCPVASESYSRYCARGPLEPRLPVPGWVVRGNRKDRILKAETAFANSSIAALRECAQRLQAVLPDNFPRSRTPRPPKRALEVSVGLALRKKTRSGVEWANMMVSKAPMSVNKRLPLHLSRKRARQVRLAILRKREEKAKRKRRGTLKTVSQFVGVFKQSQGGSAQWYAEMRVGADGRQHRGPFLTEREAGRAYDAMASESGFPPVNMGMPPVTVATSLVLKGPEVLGVLRTQASALSSFGGAVAHALGVQADAVHAISTQIKREQPKRTASDKAISRDTNHIQKAHTQVNFRVAAPFLSAEEVCKFLSKAVDSDAFEAEVRRRSVVSPVAAALGLLNGLICVRVHKKLSKLHLRKCTRLARRPRPKLPDTLDTASALRHAVTRGVSDGTRSNCSVGADDESASSRYVVTDGDDPVPPFLAELLRRVARCVGMCPLALHALVRKQERFLVGDIKEWVCEGHWRKQYRF